MTHTTDLDDRLWSATELAAWLRISPRTLQRLTAQGALPCRRVGTTPVFTQQAVLAALNAALSGPGAVTRSDQLVPLEAVQGPARQEIEEALRNAQVSAVRIGRQTRLIARELAGLRGG